MKLGEVRRRLQLMGDVMKRATQFLDGIATLDDIALAEIESIEEQTGSLDSETGWVFVSRLAADWCEATASELRARADLEEDETLETYEPVNE